MKIFLKIIFIFSSHSHSDHFNQEILSWDKENKNIIYIFSDDIKKYISESQEKFKKIFYVKEDDKIKIEDLKISVYGSTDLGVSFYINTDGKNIFHSGDLHLWHWEDDTLTEEKEMEDKYLTILNKIKNDEIKENKNIDFAFVPVDPRLGTNTFEGVEIFNEIINPKYIIPMHFENNFSAINNFLNIIGEDKGIRIEKNMTKIWS